MSLPDIYQAVRQYGDVLGKGLGDWGTEANKLGDIDDTTIYGRSQPWRGPSTFTGSSSRNIYGNMAPDVYNPMSLYQDEQGNWVKPELAQRGLSALSSAGLATQMSPYASKAMGAGAGLLGKQYIKNIATGEIAQISAKASPAVGWETTSGPGIGAGVPIGFAIKSFTDDKNPYTYTSTERMGDIAGNVAIASSVAPALGISSATASGASIAGMNPYVALAALVFSLWSGSKKKKKAKRLQKKAIKDVETAQYEGYKGRAEDVEEAREEYLADASQQQWEQQAGKYSNQYGGAYNLPSQYSYGDEGMKFSPKELNKIAKSGRNGDTMLAHVNPQEAELLKALGGSGNINPYTGLPEYGYGKALGNLLGGVTSILDPVGSAISSVASPIFSAAGSVVDPIGQAVGSGVSTVGGALSQGINTGFDLGISGVKGGLGAASNVAQGVGGLLEPILSGPMDLAMNVTRPVMEGVHDVAKPIMAGAGDVFSGAIDATLAGAKGLGELGGSLTEKILGPPTEWLSDLLSGGGGGFNLKPGAPLDLTQKRLAMGKDPKIHPLQLRSLQEGPVTSGMEEQDVANLFAGGFRGELDNPFIRENVLQLDQGGKINTVAEFTGNELIVNNQSAVEKGLASGNYSMAANPIRNAMNKGYVTPGFETHQGNPLPVDDQGNIYAAGGALPFKVNKGAGVYDSATDQFSPTMTDKEIAMVAKKNIAKWKKNNMA